MKKILFYFYYRLFRFAVSISDDFLNEWKPLVTIDLLQVFILLQVLNWYTILTNSVVKFINPANVALPLVIALGAINYYYFLHNDKWKLYNEEFEQYSKKKKIAGGISVLLVMLVIVFGVIYSFYKLSQGHWAGNVSK